jgi:hypothetical protein
MDVMTTNQTAATSPQNGRDWPVKQPLRKLTRTAQPAKVILR